MRSPPKPEDLDARASEARRRALEALSLMRAKERSLTRAAREAETTIDTVRKYAGTALAKKPNGRWSAKEWDRLPRRMKFLTPEGRIPLRVRDSRSASKMGRYEHAVDQFLKTGDRSLIKEFESETVQVDGVEHSFLIDPLTLERLANAGEVAFEDLYAQTT